MDSAKYSFPAVKGIQANMEYYVTMVPLDCIPKLFTFKDENLAPEIRSQRTLNKARIPEMCNYILANPTSYVFSALTASVDGDIVFIPSKENSDIGIINISMYARMLINDGQHRRAAIEAALKKNPDLKYEHISMVLYHDIGLSRSQQMFSDLNRFAIRPTQSLNILYDSRSHLSILTKKVVSQIPQLIDKEHTSIPNRSTALFTLSAIYHGTVALLKDIEDKEKYLDLATTFWNEVYHNMPEWRQVAEGTLKSSIVRKESLSPLSITLRSLGQVGNELIQRYPEEWASKLSSLNEINWSKKNPLWNNGIVINGKVQLSHATQSLMVDVLEKKILQDR